MGRKATKIDREQFEDLLELQCTKEDIAGFFHCSHDTIERFCRKTYGDTFLHVSDDYRSIGRVSLRRSQFAMAKNNAQMAIHLGKQYLGQTDKTETKITAEMNAKHGNLTVIAYYDPETGKSTKKEITGEEKDIDAFLDKPEDYNGDTMTFYLPEKDPDPAEIKGEKTLVSTDGTKRLHLPYDGMDPIRIEQTMTLENGDKVVSEFPDDGRGGYTGDPETDLIIEQAIDENRRVRLEWGNSKRGGHTPRDGK